MKKLLVRFLITLGVVFVLALGGCAQPTSSGDEPEYYDAPAEGLMTRATAGKIFTLAERPEGFEILKFIDAGALRDYLKGGSRQGVSEESVLKIRSISGKDVIRIGDGAFSLGSGGGNDITEVVSTLDLPETITELGTGLFADTAEAIGLNIPVVVLERIKEGIKAEKVGEGMDGDAAEAAAETALEDLLAGIVEGSKVILWAVESGKEPEKVAEGPGKAAAPSSPGYPSYPSYPSPYPPAAPPAPPVDPPRIPDPPPAPVDVAPDSPTAPAEINRQLSDPGVSKVTLPSPSGGGTATVTIDSAPLEVPPGKELEISGKVTLEVLITQTATIEGEVTVKDEGTLDFSDLPDGAVDLTGTITVESGGIFEVKNSATHNASAINYNGGTGTLVLNQGSFAYLDGTLMIGPGPGSGPLDGLATFQWPAGGSGTTIEFSEDNIIGNIITLKGGEITVSGGVKTGVGAAVIDSSATLIVNPTTMFAVRISLVVNGRLVANKLIVGGANGATITFGSGATLSGDFVATASGGIFYQGGTPEDAVPGETYTWTTNRWVR